MVREVTAYAADDGSIHESKIAAVEHDAITALSKMDIFNYASAQAIVKQADAILELLQPIVEARQN
jgi:hypothetical protein